MDEDAAVALVHQHTLREREMGVEAAGVVDGAFGNDEAHRTNLTAQS